MNTSDQERLHRERPQRRGLPLRRLIEVTPVLIALTALFSYKTIRGVDEGSELVTPLGDLLGSTSGWVALLMFLVACVGVGGMSWLLYVYTRAPVDGKGADDAATREKDGG